MLRIARPLITSRNYRDMAKPDCQEWSGGRADAQSARIREFDVPDRPFADEAAGLQMGDRRAMGARASADIILAASNQTQLLIGVQGVGEVPATTIVLESGPIDRFAAAGNLPPLPVAPIVGT